MEGCSFGRDTVCGEMVVGCMARAVSMFRGEPGSPAEVAQVSLQVTGADRDMGDWGLSVGRGREAWVREGRAPAAAASLVECEKMRH